MNSNVQFGLFMAGGFLGLILLLIIGSAVVDYHDTKRFEMCVKAGQNASECSLAAQMK